MAWDATIKAVGTLVSGEVNTLTDRAMERVKPFAMEMLQALTPVKTGNMKSRWSVATSRRLFTIRNSAYYADFINSGTRKITPHFMVEKTMEAIGEEFKEALLDEVNGVQRTKSIRDFSKQIAKIRVRGLTTKKATKT